MLGHTCVKIPSPGGGHSLTSVSDPALAMSEGWAHFVALAIEKSKTAPQPPTAHNPQPVQYLGMNWERMSITPNPNVEYCVGCTLWDLYDAPPELSTVIAEDKRRFHSKICLRYLVLR